MASDFDVSPLDVTFLSILALYPGISKRHPELISGIESKRCRIIARLLVGLPPRGKVTRKITHAVTKYKIFAKNWHSYKKSVHKHFKKVRYYA